MPVSLEREMKAIEAEKAKLLEREKQLQKRMAEKAEKDLLKVAKKYGIEDAIELLEHALKIGHQEAIARLSNKPEQAAEAGA